MTRMLPLLEIGQTKRKIMTDKEKIQLRWETIDQLNTLASDHRDDKYMDYVFRKTMAILNQIPAPELPQNQSQNDD